MKKNSDKWLNFNANNKANHDNSENENFDLFDNIKSTNKRNCNINKNNKNMQPLSIDDIYNEAGFTLKAFTILMLAILIISLEGIHFYIFSLLLLPLKVYYLINENSINVINSLVFFGFSIGSLSIGYLTKKFFRKNIILTVLIYLTIVQLLWTNTSNYYLICIERAIMGICLGILVPLVFNTTSEFLPVNIRAFCLALIIIGFSFGQLLLVLIVYSVMPNFQEDRIPEVLKHLIFYHLAIFVLFFFLFDESPKSLFNCGKFELGFIELEKTIRRELTEEERNNLTCHYAYLRICNENSDIKEDNDIINKTKKEKKDSSDKNKEINKSSSENNNIKENSNIHNNNNLVNRSITNSENKENNKNKSICSISHKKNLLDTQYFFILIITSFSGLFISFSFYGPLYIEDIEMKKFLSEYFKEHIDPQQDQSHINNFQETIFFIFASIIGYPFGAILCETPFLGRKYSIILTTLISAGVNTIPLYYPKQFFICNYIYQLLNTTFYSIFIVYFTELFPTKFKDTCTGIIYCILRIGAALSSFVYLFLYNEDYFYPLVATAVFNVIIGVLIYFIPYDTYGMEIE